ncbi:MAG: hypothetical protein ACOYB2_10465 [Limnohabitans sp.]
MYLLAAAGTLQGVASAASELTCTVFGMELNAGVEAYKPLAQVQLAASAGEVYAAPASTEAFIRTITVVNTNTTTARTFQLFVNGSDAAHAITPVFVVPAGGSAIYEDGIGWSVATIEAGTTLLNDVHSGYQDWAAMENPAVPAAGTLRLWAKAIAGRILPKFMGPAGLDSPFQPALFQNQCILFTPYGSTTVTPNGFGATWAKGGSAGTVATPTLTVTSPKFLNSMRRVTHLNAVTTTNQAMGIICNANASRQFWIGDAAGLGGFFMFARFGITNWLAGSRIFAGLGGSATERVISDTLTANTIGFWKDTTMAGSVLKFVTVDNGAVVNTIDVPNAVIQAGAVFDMFLFCRPAGTAVSFRIDQIDDGNGNAIGTLIDSSTDQRLPLNTALLGPEIEVSNGTANIVANTVGIGINRIYVESDH